MFPQGFTQVCRTLRSVAPGLPQFSACLRTIQTGAPKAHPAVSSTPCLPQLSLLLGSLPPPSFIRTRHLQSLPRQQDSNLALSEGRPLPEAPGSSCSPRVFGALAPLPPHHTPPLRLWQRCLTLFLSLQRLGGDGVPPSPVSSNLAGSPACQEELKGKRLTAMRGGRLWPCLESPLPRTRPLP